MLRRPTRLGLVFATATLVSAACGESSAPPPTAAPPGRKVDTATAGSISGRITFAGQKPPQETLKVSSDAACVPAAGPTPPSQAILIANDNGVKNVFVYVKDGLDSTYVFDVPTTAAELDQRGCQYEPRVFGVRAGQPIDVLNGDPTFHNVHALPRTNQEFNQSLSGQGSKLRRTFTAPEVMVRFKCDVHAWMTAYVGVMSHPFFAVTSADGSFSFGGLPAGTYTIEAWHERLGTRTQNVTVAAGQAASASFVFSAE